MCEFIPTERSDFRMAILLLLITNDSWQPPVCKFSGIRYVRLSFLREPHSTDYELWTVLFSYDFYKAKASKVVKYVYR